ncbi:WbqC family protein [Parvibaculum lavamentivorans]|nr:WbqC family protein [Parvibaculum lavamentivorans]
MARADKFIHMDDVAFTKKDWRSRNRIKLNNGPHWLSVPIVRQPLGTQIREMEVNYSTQWVRKHLGNIESAYRDAPYFDVLAAAVFPILEKRFRKLVDLNISLVEALMIVLEIDTPSEYSSNLCVEFSGKSDRVLQICHKVEADTLYDGSTAKDFIDLAAFESEGVSVVFQEYQHPVYPQGKGSFLSHLSVVDLIAHTGPAAGALLRDGGGG